VQDNAGVLYTSVDNGTSWDTKADIGSSSTQTTKLATDGAKFAFATTNGFAYSSTDNLATVIDNTPTTGSRSGMYYLGGVWLARSSVDGVGGAGTGFERNTAERNWLMPNLAANLSLFVDTRDFADEVGYDGLETMAAFYYSGSAFLYGSYDNGATWESIGTLSGNLKSVVALPGLASSTIPDSSELLSTIVADICDRCGIPASKLDLSELTDEVKGLTLGGQYDGAGAITTLMPPYWFDLYEADKEVRAPKRGGAVKATITEADLVEDIDENALRGQDIPASCS
jgi:hypothetical protein